jgi:hypothetical protein
MNTSRFRTNNTPSCCDKKQEAKEKETTKKNQELHTKRNVEEQ